MNRIFLPALALVCACAPALAAEVVTKIFRAMHLDASAGAANVLGPLLEQLEAGKFWKPVISPATKVAVVTHKPARPVAHPAAQR